MSIILDLNTFSPAALLPNGKEDKNDVTTHMRKRTQLKLDEKLARQDAEVGELAMSESSVEEETAKKPIKGKPDVPADVEYAFQNFLNSAAKEKKSLKLREKEIEIRERELSLREKEMRGHGSL